ncbi:MAG: hypothetical protein OEN00_09435 [Gemmatimonadota bacterium]|nr:hypothetical protein [Gemmatimonadota bacterium]
MRTLLAGLALAVALAPLPARAQELADFDYEHLSFRGFGFDAGYLWPTRVDPTYSIGLRIDMGYAGPGLRIVPNVTYWSSALVSSEVTELEDRISQLIEDQTGLPPSSLDLGTVDWRDVAIGVDAHVVWDSLFDLLTYGGLGISAHFMDGGGPAIAGTFIEDALDAVTAGFNLHFGVEYPVTERFRLYSVAKYEVMSDLQFFHVRAGWQLMTGPNAPGEER